MNNKTRKNFRLSDEALEALYFLENRYNGKFTMTEIVEMALIDQRDRAEERWKDGPPGREN